MKSIVFWFLLFFSTISFGQFQSPEPKMILPELKLPENNLNYLKSYRKKVKKSIIDKKTTEFDEEGNVIKEIIVDFPIKKTILYNYSNGVLVEKSTTSEANSQALNRLNSETLIREADQNAVALYEDVNQTELYKAILDSKNRVISFTNETNYKDNKPIKTRKSISETSVVYDNNAIVEIKKSNATEHYFYDKNLIVKKELTQTQGPTKNIETDIYTYDKNKNLIAIHHSSQIFYPNKPVRENRFLKDSAVYNNKNQLIRSGTKIRHITYQYDSKNNLTERFQFIDEKPYLKEELVYTNNLVTKHITTHFNTAPKENSIITTTYDYKNDSLINQETQGSSAKFCEKITYQYDSKTRIEKVSKYTRIGTANPYKPSSEKRWEYTENSLKIIGSYGDINIYEFY